MRASCIGVAALVLAGCQAHPPEVVEINGGFADLDCAKGFDALVQTISTIPGIVAATYPRGVSAYRDDRTSTL